jgi:hypothetical protein
MNQRLCLLAAALLCTGAPPALAQAGRVSHVPIEGGIPPGADAYLQSRLHDAQTSADLERLIAELATHPEKLGINKPEDLEKLQQALTETGGQPEKALGNEEVRRIIGEAAQRRAADLGVSPEEQDRLKEIARRFSPAEPESGDSVKLGGARGRPAASADTSPSPETKPPPVSASPSVTPTPPPVPPPASGAMKEHLRDIADALADSPLADSPAFRRMVASINRVKTPQAPGFVGWDRRLEQWLERFATVGSHMPKLSWPKADLSARGPRGRPVAGPVAPPDAAGSGTELVSVLLGAATAGLIAWGLLRRRGLIGPGARGGWRLGPWPVRPEAVGTRDELVRAFEYLALLRLGPVARNRNHRDIAAGLGAEDEARRPAAERLAGLYEQARYAPPDEALPDADLADARAALSLLAGVAAA